MRLAFSHVGNLTPEAVRGMEGNVDRAVDELAATGVDVIAYCDMVTTFIMEPGWNEAKVAEIAHRSEDRYAVRMDRLA